MNKKVKMMPNEDQELLQQEKYLDYTSNTLPIVTITIPIDEPIRESSYYRYVAKGIEDLTENDQVRFNISSVGGMLSGLETLLSALDKTDAVSVACINSDCHSAASILALKCDIIEVTQYAQMLVHYVTFGVGGPSNHVFKHSEHIKKVSEKLFRETYYGFLSEDEINKCIDDDYQLWLDAEQIRERLEQRQNRLLKEQQKAQRNLRKQQKVPMKKPKTNHNKDEKWTLPAISEQTEENTLTNN